MSNPNMQRGLIPTPRHKLLAAVPFRPIQGLLDATPAQFVVIPKKLNMGGNDTYGDCVTAEESAAKNIYSLMCGLPEVSIPAANVIAWARKHGVLNGADLVDVMEKMITDGLVAADGTTYFDGKTHLGVDYSKEDILKAAIMQGPVKLGIDANGLPSDAGNHNGWWTLSGTHHGNEDHCVNTFGFGTAGWIFEQAGIPLPAGLPASTPGYVVFTWGTYGFVTHAWFTGSVGEAWVRVPTTVGQTPVPTPIPTPTPIPPAPIPVPPTPVPVLSTFTIHVSSQPVTVTNGLGATLHGSMPAFDVTGTINPPASAVVGLSPFVKIALQLLCANATLLPQPYQNIAMAICGLLPADKAPCECADAA